MVDIFDEVDEELRAENAQKLFMRYWGVIAAVVLAVVGGTSGWKGWEWWQARQDAIASATFVTAINAADTGITLEPATRGALIGTFENLIATAPEGYRTLARLRAAALKADAGDLAGAVQLWDQVAGDGAADPLLRDLATLVSTQRQIDQGDPARLESRLKPLTDPANPWRPLARELLGLLDLRQGRTAEAQTLFRALLQDPTTPAGVRNRATALLNRLGA